VDEMRVTLALLHLLGVQGVSLVSPARTRAVVREQLINCLKSQQPVRACDTLHMLVEELETLAALPATSDFHLLGLRGSWSERLQSDLSTANAAMDLNSTHRELVRVSEVEQHFETDRMRCIAAFDVASEGISGSLEVQASVYPTTKSDMLHLMMTGHTLNLDRTPKDVSVPTLVEALIGQLGPEFRAEDGVRLGVQTSYIDEELRITRCTTRHLAGYVTVHSRQSGP